MEYVKHILQTLILKCILAVDLKTPPGSLYQGEPKGVRAGCTLTLSDEDFVQLANGELNAQQVW